MQNVVVRLGALRVRRNKFVQVDVIGVFIAIVDLKMSGWAWGLP